MVYLGTVTGLVTCKLCQFTFTQGDEIKKHEKAVHAKHKKWFKKVIKKRYLMHKCKNCDEMFVAKEIL